MDMHSNACFTIEKPLYKQVAKNIEIMETKEDLINFIKTDFIKIITDHITESTVLFQTKMEEQNRTILSLKQEIESIKNSIRFQTRKRITDVLNQNLTKTATTPFHDWLKLLAVTDEDLQIVFEKNIIEGMKSVMKKTMNQFKTTPIKSFFNKRDIVYLYEGDSWRQMVLTDFNKVFFTLSQRFLRKCMEWLKTTTIKTEEDEEKNVHYIMKINGANEDKTVNELRKWIYENTQTNITEYINS
jgi:hypothetical protein